MSVLRVKIKMGEALRIIQSLLRDPDNRMCADCKAKQSEWASTGLGVFICIDCSGVHRSLGTHITLVRSCTLDTWSMDAVRRMQAIGNKVANQYWEANLTDDVQFPSAGNLSEITRYIKMKYINKKWAAEGLSPNQIIDNVNQAQAKPQHFAIKKRHHKQEKPQESLANRIKNLRNKNQTQIAPKHHPLERIQPKIENEVVEEEVAPEPEPQIVENEAQKTETEQKEDIDPFDDDDFFSEPKPKSAAAKAIMNGQNPLNIQRNKSTNHILSYKPQNTESIIASNPVMQKPMTPQQRLDNFFTEERERAPIAQRPNIIRSGNRVKKAKAEESKNKLSARIQQKIERRKRQVGLQRHNVEDSDSEHAENDLLN